MWDLGNYITYRVFAARKDKDSAFIIGRGKLVKLVNIPQFTTSAAAAPKLKIVDKAQLCWNRLPINHLHAIKKRSCARGILIKVSVESCVHFLRPL